MLISCRPDIVDQQYMKLFDIRPSRAVPGCLQLSISSNRNEQLKIREGYVRNSYPVTCERMRRNATVTWDLRLRPSLSSHKLHEKNPICVRESNRHSRHPVPGTVYRGHADNLQCGATVSRRILGRQDPAKLPL